MDNVTVDSLEKKFPGEGFDRFAQIAKIGGFGEPTRDHTGGLDPAYKGGLDLKGLENVEGPDRLTDAKLNKIKELSGQVQDVVIDEKKSKEKK